MVLGFTLGLKISKSDRDVNDTIRYLERVQSYAFKATGYDVQSFKKSQQRAVFISCIKVTMHLQTDHFFEILIFRLMYRSTHELSSKKKILKNIK